VKQNYQTIDAAVKALAMPEVVSVAIGDIVADVREGLLAMAVGAGLQVMDAMMDADVVAVCGPKGKHDPNRTAVRHGSEKGSVTLGGRRVPIERPRMRGTDGSGELPVASYELFTSTELLGRMAMAKMLAGISTRRYPVGLEPVGEKVEQAATATSKSAISRRFVKATETALADLLAQPLGDLDLVALMLDGVHFGEHVCVVALGIGIDGTKHPLALVEGDTENTTVVTDLLVGLRDRGLDTTRPILVVIDGAKALRAAVTRVFDHPVIARCQLHKTAQRDRPAAGSPRFNRGQADAAGLPGRHRPRGRSPTRSAGQRTSAHPPWRGCLAARGPGRNAHRAAPGRTTYPGPHSPQHQQHRVDDQHRPRPQPQRQKLAVRRHGAALVRRRHDRSQQAVPPRERTPPPDHTQARSQRACHRHHRRCHPSE
jgi:putative transposase